MSFFRIVWPYLYCKNNIVIALIAFLSLVVYLTVTLTFINLLGVKILLTVFALTVTALLLMGFTFDTVTSHANFVNSDMIMLFFFYGTPFDRFVPWSEMQNWMDENQISTARCVRIHDTTYYLFSRKSDVLAFKLAFYE